MDIFAPFNKQNGVFIVRNITPDRKKTIKIFNYPINWNQTRDLLAIPGVAEDDIRASLLKGELNHKLRCGDIVIVDSDIDLLQFNDSQKKFLKDNGIVIGTEVSQINLRYPVQEDKDLIGVQNSINTIFTTDNKFIFTFYYKPRLYVNGVKQKISHDYLLSESGGPGTGFDTVIYVIPPVFSDILTIDYYLDQ